jgi:hypothetical protein
VLTPWEPPLKENGQRPRLSVAQSTITRKMSDCKHGARGRRRTLAYTCSITGGKLTVERRRLRFMIANKLDGAAGPLAQMDLPGSNPITIIGTPRRYKAAVPSAEGGWTSRALSFKRVWLPQDVLSWGSPAAFSSTGR